MPTDPHDFGHEPDEMTLPSRQGRTTSLPPLEPLPHPAGAPPPAETPPPWLLQEHYEGRIDLAAELSALYPAPPLVTVFKTHKARANSRFHSASIAGPDGTVTLHVEARADAPQARFTFTLSSMMTLRFAMLNLTEGDCAHWLRAMRWEPNRFDARVPGSKRVEEHRLAFLWGQQRWQQDYLLSVVEHKFATLYAFSLNGYEACLRLTRDSKLELHNWLASTWNTGDLSTQSQQLAGW